MKPYADTITDPYGNAVQNVSVLVKDAGGALVTLYADDGQTPIANPLTTDERGRFSFYAPSGNYFLTVAGSGIQFGEPIPISLMVDGSVWRNAAGAPSDALGVDGDYYLNVTNGDVYQKAVGVYGVVGNIKGATGATGSTGATGATGSTGPASWTTVAVWLTSTPYTNGPPASVVTNGGETYVCLVVHTSGTFATDLAAGNWTKVAQKGMDGIGIGDLLAANNLSDVANAGTARTNLGLGTTNTPSFENVALTGTGGVAGYTDFTNGTEVANPAAGVVRLHGETENNFPQLEIVDSTGVHVVLGRDSVLIVRNTSGATITVGKAVYVTGSTGATPNVSLARSDAAATLNSTIGLVLDASIAHNAYGRVMTLGTLDAVNTSAFATGAILYVDPTTAGALTTTKPTGLNFIKAIGTVLNSGVGNGSIYILVAPATTQGLDAGDSPQFAGVNLGHASDTTLTRVSAGVVAIEGKTAAVLSSTQTFSAAQTGSITGLTDGANIATDLALNNFFSVTLAGNRTLDNPTNIVAGQSGCIFITQDATGSRTLAYGTYWDFAGGTAPVLSTAANSVDRLDYVVRTTTSIHAALTKAWA